MNIRRLIVICSACMLCSGALMLWGLGGQRTSAPDSPARYALLFVDDSGTAVMQCKQGAQTAADERSVMLTSYTVDAGPGGGMSATLARVEADQARGLVLWPCEKAAADEAIAFASSRGIPLVCIANSLPGGATTVATDDVALGRALGEHLLSLGHADGWVDVYQIDEPLEALRLEGLSSAIGSDRVRLHSVDGPDWFATAFSAPGSDSVAVISLSEALTAPLAIAVDGQISVLGVDPGDDRVTLLESGLVQGLAFEMPYAQGYLAVMALAKAAAHATDGTRIDSPVRVVSAETMYDAENVKLVFPLLQ